MHGRKGTSKKCFHHLLQLAINKGFYKYKYKHDKNLI